MLYDVVEAPLGLMYLMTSLYEQFGEKVCGKIAKSRMDFDNYSELKKLITEFGCGFAVDPLDARDIAHIVEYLYHNLDLRKKMGERGRALVLEKYNWENESQKLLNIYSYILKQ